jgi:hypothetical protein
MTLPLMFEGHMADAAFNVCSHMAFYAAFNACSHMAFHEKPHVSNLRMCVHALYSHQMAAERQPCISHFGS